MKTIYVTGNDTEIGKTWTIGVLAKHLRQLVSSVQIVKPVQTGVPEGSMGDVESAIQMSGLSQKDGFTLLSYSAPTAPVTAAELEGDSLTIGQMEEKLKELPEADFRVIEGAGGIEVPLDKSGTDRRELAHAMNADAIVLIVSNRLGTINQSRLLYHYVKDLGIDCGVWLNEHSVVSDQIRNSNYTELSNVGVPIWGSVRFESKDPEIYSTFWS